MAKRTKADVKHAIDLLWFHQIRRENAALHKEVKNLQQQAEELRTISEKATVRAETAIACLEEALADQTTLQTAVDNTYRRAQDAVDKIASLEESVQDARANQTKTITHFHQDVDKLRADLARFQELHKLEISQAATSIQHISTKLNSEYEQSELANLEHRISHIEDFLQQGQYPRSISRIEDSVDDQHCGGYGEETNPQLTLEEISRTSGRPTPDLQDEKEEAALKLTLRDANDRNESTDVEDIDLDENITTMSYARNTKKDVPVPDSLVILPQHDSHLTQANAVQSLKQGRFHSWDRYFTEGQALVEKHPRRLEFAIVTSFVQGLYAAKQHEQCEQWLDVNGWTWESVAHFGLSNTPSIPVHLESTDPRNTRQSSETAEKKAKGRQDQGAVSKVPDQSMKRPEEEIQKPSTFMPQASSPLRQQSQLANGAYPPKEAGKVRKLRKTKTRSQRRPTKWVRARRDANGRLQSQRQSSPLVSESPSQANDHIRITGRTKVAPRRNCKPAEHHSSMKHTNARPSKQQANGAIGDPEANTRLETSQEFPECPGTPPCQQTPAQDPEQTIPRLVKRRRSIDRIFEKQGRKRRRLMDEEGLSPLPPQPFPRLGNNESRRRKRRRLPLPPPPEIPIMPTSDE